jgi:hypothetical protein
MLTYVVEKKLEDGNKSYYSFSMLAWCDFTQCTKFSDADSAGNMNAIFSHEYGGQVVGPYYIDEDKTIRDLRKDLLDMRRRKLFNEVVNADREIERLYDAVKRYSYLLHKYAYRATYGDVTKTKHCIYCGKKFGEGHYDECEYGNTFFLDAPDNAQQQVQADSAGKPHSLT